MENIKILLIEPSEAIGDVIIKGLQRAFNATVIFHQTSAEGVQRLKDGEVFSLIISRNVTPETPGFSEIPLAAPILNVVYDLQLNIPLIVIGEFEHTYKKYALVSDRLRIEEINRLILKALNLKKEDFEHLKLPEYISFPVKHFYLMTTSPCDVYIRLVKKTGDEYVKRLKYGETFSKFDLKKYEDLGLTEFFVLRIDYEEFMNGLFAQAINHLKKVRTLDDTIEVLGDSFVIGTEMMKVLGITPGCLIMVDQTIQLMKSQIQKTDKLGQLLRKLLDDKMSYNYRHSYLICALSYTLLPKMEWGSGDQQSILLEKICMVSYFHDIYLDNDKLARISDVSGLKKAKLNNHETELINNHANKAALLVQSYPKLPQGVDLIIKQHHGVSNGVGFPEVLVTTISPMAIFFMVVEEFATNILNLEDPPENVVEAMRQAINPLKGKFQLPSYRKIVTEIENMLTIRKK